MIMMTGCGMIATAPLVGPDDQLGEELVRKRIKVVAVEFAFIS